MKDRSLTDHILKFRSVKAKILVLILPAVLLIIFFIVTVSILYARNMIMEQTHYGMNEQLNRINNGIQVRIAAHGKLPETFAKTAGELYKDLSIEQYQMIAKKNLESNPDTFALGIFFEPNRYNVKNKYVSVYAYRENMVIKTSDQYNDPNYDYPTQPWYTLAEGKNGVVFADAYYNLGMKAAMVTAAVPIYDQSNQRIGVTIGDINLSTIQKLFTETKVGKSGWAFLLDKNGTYLAGPAQDKIMKEKLQEDWDPALAKLGKTLLEKKTGALVQQDKNGLVDMYYQEVPGTHWILAIAIPDQELSAPINSLTLKLSLIGIAGIVLICGLILLFSGNITKHIGRINLISRYLSQGNFTHIIPVVTRDEFGKMAENFNGTTVLLREMLAKVSDHSIHVASTSGQLSESAEEMIKVFEHVSSAIQEVASGAETQVRGAEESARAMEELSIGIQKIAASSSVVSDTTQETSNRTLQGNEIILTAVRDMNHANHAVRETSVLIGKLKERSAEIGKIITVISEISAQTNLLALNAHIESARAGEHGRGFSVVAAEIRKLADQTTQFTQQIRSLIEETQGYTSEAVRSMKLGTDAVENGAGHVRQAGEAFDAILTDIRSIVVQSQEISAASEEMSAGSQQVTATVEELWRIALESSGNSQKVAAASEEQLAAMEEISSSSQSLSIAAQELQDLTAKFKV